MQLRKKNYFDKSYAIMYDGQEKNGLEREGRHRRSSYL